MTTDLSGPSRRKHITLVATAAAVFAVDLATKITASAALADRDIDLPGPLDLRLSHNPGVAFGMGNDTPTWLVLTLTGALANVADRSQAGTVVDMLYTGWWPTFNVADVAIVCGAFALAATAWRAPPEPATVP